MLGTEQWDWLEEEIQSAAKFSEIIIGSSTELLSQHQPFEKWANFPAARERLLRLLQSSPVPSKLVLSGDRHFAELSQLQFAPGNRIVEATASGLTHSFKEANEANEFRLGNLWPQTNYGLIKFFIKKKKLVTLVNLLDLESHKVVNEIVLTN